MKSESYSVDPGIVLLQVALAGVEKGCYICVGAKPASRIGVTRGFYSRGWRGINIEPVSDVHETLRGERCEDLNLRVAIGDQAVEMRVRDGIACTDSAPGASGFVEGQVLEGELPLLTLQQICEEHVGTREIHFLAIGGGVRVESALRGMDFARWMPWVLMVESSEMEARVRTQESWESLLEGEYDFSCRGGRWRFYVRRDRGEIHTTLRAASNAVGDLVSCLEEPAEARVTGLEEELRFLRRQHQCEVEEKDVAIRKCEAEVVRERALRLTELNAIRSSISYRVTGPLRSLKALTMRLADSRRIFRGISGLALGAFRRSPAWKRRLLRVLGRFPAIESRLRGLIRELEPAQCAPFERAPAGPARDLEIRNHSRRTGPDPTIFCFVNHTVKYESNTGVQRLTRGLSRGLMELGKPVVFVKWSSDLRQFVLADRMDLERLSRWNGPEGAVWNGSPEPPESSVLVRLESESIAPGDWMLFPEVSYLRCGQDSPGTEVSVESRRIGLKSAFLYYDAIPLVVPGYGCQVDEHLEYVQMLALADLVLPISEWVGRDLLGILHSDLGFEKESLPAIRVVRPAGEQPQVKRGRPRESSGAEVLVLCVGTVEPRKNQTGLLRAFERLLRVHPELRIRLKIVGHLHPDVASEVYGVLRRCPEIEWLNYVCEDELLDLYQRAAFTVFPSVEEGFGLPILESLWHGKACLCANFGSMAEVARGGGCLLEDTRDPEALYRGLEKLATDSKFLAELGVQATSRHIRTWSEYAKELAEALELAERSEPLPELEPAPLSRFRNLPRRPLLSLCVSTYNRAEWLEKSMENLRRLVPRIPDELEILVCDNASTDRSAEVVKPHLGWAGFRWVQNPVNVGLLGNLRITANQSRGRYVWIMGDDDFPRPGAIERILEQLRKRPSIDLLYLNYAVTHAADPRKIRNLDAFLSAAIPASPPRDSVEGRVVDLAPLTENFFSAIYAIVFRRDHAIRAYSQDCSGPPFSSMRSCIPTTSYCLKEIHGRSALWLGEPAIVANMNVSWRPYLALWLLERLPEAHDLAVEQGAGAEAVDFWRARNLPVALYHLERLLEQDGDSAASWVCLERFHERHRHLDEFRSRERQFAKLWHRAHERGWVTRALPPGAEGSDG